MIRRVYKSSLMLMIVMILGLASAGIVSATGTVTDIPNPDTYTCSQPGYIDFESYPDGFNLSADAISGIRFTTTGGYTWRVGDFATGSYNGKYPSGAYTSQGTHWAWLGTAQGTGRIDFVFGPASYFSLLTSVNLSNVYLEAYDAGGTLLDMAGPSGLNVNTGHMYELEISRATPDIAYIIVHDAGNFFLVDSICTDAPGVANEPPVADPNGPYYGNEGSPVAFDGTGSYDPDGDPLTYDWDFGDGTIALNAGPTPNHTYDDNGVYDICLTVTDPGGLSDTQCASTTPMNVVFALDSSGSMAWNDPSGLRRTASKDFVDKMDATQDLAGVVSWDYYIDFASPLSSDFATVKSQIDMVNSSGGTNLDVGLNAAIGLLDSGKQADASWVIIMLSNGEGTYTGGPTADAAAKGYIIYSIGLGPAPATEYLTDMASQTGGQYYPAPTAENLQVIFDDIYVTVSGKAYISNVTPTATFNAPGEVNEGEGISLSLTDPNDPSNADTTFGFEYAFDCGDGSGYGTWSSDTSAVCPTDDNELRTVKGRIRDKDGGTTEYTASVTVNNVAPTVNIDSVSPTLIAVGESVTANGSFTDPSTSDTHTAVWDWGDGTTAGTVSGLSVGPDGHTYSAAGIYTIKLTVTDDDGGIGTADYKYVVVYDPSAGFVTGGGWIYSEPGAYIPDPGLEGKANFGFVSKYKKGATVPDGNTEFQFHAAGLNFHSDTYEWLVVTGSNYAMFKGVGTINGMGEYKFMLWAGDDTTDTFRIKIWEEDEFGVETVIYDNGSDQAIGGGSIVIHKK